MDHFQTLLQPEQVIVGGYQLKTTYFLRHQPPKEMQQAVAGLKSLSVNRRSTTRWSFVKMFQFG